MGKRLSLDELDSIKKDWIQNKIYNEDKFKKLMILTNPVLWAEDTLRDPDMPDKSLRLRWYQKEVLLCTNRFRAIRMGRRIGKSVALITDALWNSLTEPGIRCLLLTPRKSQILLLWEYIDAMVYGNPVLKGCVVSDTSDPFKQITFTNGSYIRGIPTRQHPENVRGQSCDAMYLDEADFLGAAALAALIPIIGTNKDVSVWASSTPSGAREWFYNINHQPLYSKFHYSSSVSPQWGPEMEASLRASIANESDWEKEVEAEWGDLYGAVFKSTLIDQCIIRNMDENGSHYDPVEKKRYRSFGDYKHSKKDRFVLGIDWNGEAYGVRILVMRIRPIAGTFKLAVVDKMVINEKEYIQALAIRAIVDLNARYNPDWIFCDQGYGTTQIEELHRYGHQYKDTGLDKKVIGINFGQMIEVDDPFAKVQGKPLKTKKPLKHLMIDNASRILESSLLELPKSEEVNYGLVWEMRNYRIEKINADGKTIFSKENDHWIAALVLCLYCFRTKYTNADNRHLNNAIILTTNNVMITDAGKPTVESRMIGDIKRNDNDFNPDPYFAKLAQSMGFNVARKKEESELTNNIQDPMLMVGNKIMVSRANSNRPKRTRKIERRRFW